MEQPRYKFKPFIFQGAATVLAASTGQINFSVPANWAFKFTKFSFVATVSVINVQATFDIQFLDQDEQLFNDYVPCDVFAGVLQNKTAVPWVRTVLNPMSDWHKFDTPHIYEPKSNILVNVRNTSAQTNVIQVTLGGSKMIRVS